MLYSALFPQNTVAASLAVDTAGTVHAAGTTGLVSAFPEGSAPGQAATPHLYGTSNSAGGSLGGRIAPGELISIYGLNFGPPQPAWASVDESGFLPTTLGGVSLTMDGKLLPLLYVSGTQVNAIAPVELTPGAISNLQLTFNGSAELSFRTAVVAAMPQVFRNPDGSAAAINQDGTINSPTNPAPIGSIVSIWATGTGYFPGLDGQIATAANFFCSLSFNCAVNQVDWSTLSTGLEAAPYFRGGAGNGKWRRPGQFPGFRHK